MSFDVIVFSQNELDSAVESDTKSVCICDGGFILPLAGGVTYTAIGGARAVIYADKSDADKLGIVFDGFTPLFVPTNAAFAAPSYGTSASSYASSYFMSSFAASYIYRYMYGSLGASYASSYTASYRASYTASFSMSYTSSFLSAALSVPDAPTDGSGEYDGEVIMVNGYGINLI